MYDRQKYAGFWKRFLAYFIDQTILNIVGLFLFLPFLFFVGILIFNEDGMGEYRYSTVNFPDNFTEYLTGGDIALIIFGALIFTLVSIVVRWLYYSLFEISSKQATPGKMILSLKVVDIQGNKISFGKASGRYFGKIISGLILNIGFIMAAFTEKKQTLHDILAGCLVYDQSRFIYENYYERTNNETN